MPIGAILAFVENENYERMHLARVQRRRLRDQSDPMSLADHMFISYYRVNKDSFIHILRQIEPQLEKGSIPLPIQLGTVLRYLAVGAFQAVIGRDVGVSLAGTTVCTVMWKVINVLENTLCREWINLERTEQNVRECKKHFFDKFRIPGVVGCIDGTLFRILKPTQDESLYFNRKGYFSINGMIICDHKMRILCIDACRPGSSHDSLIWKVSAARTYVLNKYSNGDNNSWFLADSGYPLEPYLLTPFRNPAAGSVQHNFNKRHASGRNIVKRVIGNLKSRFRCLQTALPYKPEKVVKIVNVCCALHNICKYFNAHIEDDPMPVESLENENEPAPDDTAGFNSLRDRQTAIRNEIANSI